MKTAILKALYMTNAVVMYGLSRSMADLAHDSIMLNAACRLLGYALVFGLFFVAVAGESK